jgi:AcrR family transcriptional regulator
VTRARLLEQAIEHLARHGVGDQSLRQIAAGMGTSHRMLIYHFGSRAGLLAAVVDAMERQERRTLEEMTRAGRVPAEETARDFWRHVADVAPTHGPLYFELASHAMQRRPHTEPLREANVAMWVEALTQLWRRAGAAESEAAVSARLNLAVARGLLHDLLLTGDREAVDAAMRLFTRAMFPGAAETGGDRPPDPGRG